MTATLAAISWPEAFVYFGLIILAICIVGGGMAMFADFRKTKLTANQEEDLRKLVQRYEQLAASTMDAQQRVATDVAELRSRAISIEKILQTVE